MTLPTTWQTAVLAAAQKIIAEGGSTPRSVRINPTDADELGAHGRAAGYYGDGGLVGGLYGIPVITDDDVPVGEYRLEQRDDERDDALRSAAIIDGETAPAPDETPIPIMQRAARRPVDDRGL